ncbi:MAG: hypothetical protein A4E53_03692 [Pelotomaculum sp. PtaB.Bin104]|nr:MAG: hypothetical protein A4E53_03692 [Pelotomaculum sp. PtaB.Bin104]
MRILIITYSFAPAITPRAFRWAAIAEYWVKQGHNVDVICAWMPSRPRNEVYNGINVYRVGRVLTEIMQRHSPKTSVYLNNDINSKEIISTSLNQVKSSFLVTCVKWLHNNTWKKAYWPDYACLWYFPALKKAKQLFLMNKYDGMVTISHPFTGHLIGLSVKKSYHQMPWLVDIGDPFSFLENTPVNNNRLYNTLNYFYERKVLNGASTISVTTDATLKRYAELFPESTIKIHVIPPLISSEESLLAEDFLFPIDEKIRLVFVGTLYKSIRNPDFLLQLYNKLLQTKVSEQLELHFFGNINDCQSCFEPYKKLYGKKIFLHGSVNRIKAIKAMKEADILINIGNDTSYQLPSKVVEYVSTGKPILNIVKTNKDSSVAFFKSYPVIINILENVTMLETERFDKLIDFIENSSHIEVSILKDWLDSFRIETIAATYERILKCSN